MNKISVKAINNFKEANRNMATALVEQESYQVIFNDYLT